MILIILFSGCISDKGNEPNEEESEPNEKEKEPIEEKKLPDLNISKNEISFKYLNATLKEGEWVNISVIVHNLGKANATNISVRFFNDSEIISYKNKEHILIKEIPINESRLVWMNWVPNHSGLINITIKVYCNEIESNFTNNFASKELEVKHK